MHHTLPGKRVLIVEDNPLLAHDIKDLMEDLGAVPIGPALDLQTGFALLNDNDPDAALLDVDLAGELVWPLAEALSARRVPFAFISADCTQEYLPDRYRRMVCLEKPTTTEELVGVISELAARAG